MKKLIAGMAGTALMVGLILTSCQDDKEYEISESIPSLSGPNVKANTDYKGVVALTWNRVDNANGYDVYRRIKDGRDILLTQTSISTVTDGKFPGYLDIVSADNLLENEKEYTYTVIAKSNDATGLGRATVVQNGKSEVTVRIPSGHIPEQGSAYDGIADIANVRIDKVGTNYIVSWDRDYNVGVSYTVTGTYVYGSYNPITTSFTPSVTYPSDINRPAEGSAIQPTRATVRDVFATNGGYSLSKITITAAFGGSTTYNYYSGTVATLDLPVPVAIASDLQVSYNFDVDAVYLAWDVPEAGYAYTVYTKTTDTDWIEIPFYTGSGTPEAALRVEGTVSTPTPYRQIHQYKVVAVKETSTLELTGTLSGGIYDPYNYSSGFNIIANTTGFFPTFSGQLSFTVTANNNLHSGETLALYYAPYDGIETSNYTKLEGDVTSNGTATTLLSGVLSDGSYKVKAVLTSGGKEYAWNVNGGTPYTVN